MLSGFSSPAEHSSVVRIRRSILSDVLAECRLYLPLKHKKSKSSGYVKSWMNAASNRLWPPSASVEDDVPRWWFADITEMAEAGTEESFLNAPDIFKLFLILKQLNCAEEPAEKNICQVLIPYYEHFFGTAFSLWYFLCVLDDAWVFRYPRSFSEDDFLKVNSSPSNTPPPEEDTCGEERFKRLVSLDKQTLGLIVETGCLMFLSHFDNHMPSDRLGMLIDKLIGQDVVWLQTLLKCLAEIDPACFYDPDFWQGCLRAEDPAVFFSYQPAEEVKGCVPSGHEPIVSEVVETNAEEETEIEVTKPTPASPDFVGIPTTFNTDLPFSFLLTPDMRVARPQRQLNTSLFIGFSSLFMRPDMFNIYPNSLNDRGNTPSSNSEDEEKLNIIKGPQ